MSPALYSHATQVDHNQEFDDISKTGEQGYTPAAAAPHHSFIPLPFPSSLPSSFAGFSNLFIIFHLNALTCPNFRVN